MKPGAALAVSVCLNLALAGAGFQVWRKPDATKPPGPPGANVSQFERTDFATASVSTSNPPPSAATTYVTNRFSWSRAESDDLEKLAANLRAIGCPEKTIRDLAVARARRAMDHVYRDGPRLPFWIAGDRWERAAAERERLRDDARAKIREALRRAVGFDGDPTDGRLTRDFEEQALLRFIIGPMPEETFSQLLATMNRFHERKDAVNERCHGVQLDEDIAELKALQAEFARDVAAVLTRERFEEFSARCAMMSAGGEVKWEATDLTPAEVRQVALIRARFQGPTTDFFDSWRSATDEEDEQVRAETRAFLGERRSVEYERAADGNFQRLFDLGQAQNLPGDAVVKAYDIRQLAANEVGQLREDKSLSDAERRQRLEHLQAETQETMLKTLGATACQQYLQRGGEWVTNFSKL